MAFTARFPGKCSACGRYINTGDSIEGQKGAYKHAACAGHTNTGSRRGSGGRVKRTPAKRRDLQPGEIEVFNRTPDAFEVGSTKHMTKVAGGGGSDGHYFVIVASGNYRVSEFEDDTREGELASWAHVRPATDVEAAACAQEIEGAALRAARKDNLKALLKASYSSATHSYETPPVNLVSLWAENRMAGSETWYLGDNGAVYYCQSDYDMGPSYWKTTASVELVEEAKALGLRPNLL